jgi:predicted pyridoxine 5'-phosphate oxidase superfamily flavin-nucleotide-binding protein
MAESFGSLAFTPTVKALQERHGSRQRYARVERSPYHGLGPDETAFIAERDSFYMASVSETGWPYVQHRGGPKGFLKVIDQNTIAFADFRGNRQYVSTGNLMKDDRVALIMIDYPRQERLKILGHAKILEGTEAGELVARVSEPGYKAVVERVFVIEIEAFDWNCPQHITPRFTVEQIQESLASYEKRIAELEQENRSLRDAFGKSQRNSPDLL